MEAIMWCPRCKKNIRAVLKFNWWLVALLIAFYLLSGFIINFFGIAGAAAYILWFLFAKQPKCPICGIHGLWPRGPERVR